MPHLCGLLGAGVEEVVDLEKLLFAALEKANDDLQVPQKSIFIAAPAWSLYPPPSTLTVNA